MTTEEVLKQSIVEGMVVKLPAIQLERNEYLEVKKRLELIGGRWKGGKTQGFVFTHDPKELLGQVAEGAVRNLKKESQSYFTPAALATYLVKTFIKIEPEDKVCEPSAGHGAFITAIRDVYPDHPVDCFEINELHQTVLKKFSGVRLLHGDFLKCGIENHYDLVIANPPFSKNQDIDHIRKMFEVCKPGGTILTIASNHWERSENKKEKEFKKWLDDLEVYKEEIPAGAFKDSGTMISACVLRIEKPKEVEVLGGVERSSQAAVIGTPDFSIERACRVCGCTEDDCRQCIKKTGQPCQWVEDDLCSACVPKSTEVLLAEIEENEKQISKEFKELKTILTTNNEKTMEQIFFRALFALLNDKQVVKITTTRVGDKLTLLINKDNKLITMTGNPEEVDNGIINHLKVNTEPTEQKFNVTVQDAPESETGKVENGSKAASKKKTEPAKRKVKSSEKEPAFMMKMEIGEALQPIVGKVPLARTEVTKKVWDYIKKNGLQDKKQKRTIHSDENLKIIFGGKKTVSMFELTKLVNKHLTMVKVSTESKKVETKQDTSKDAEAAKEMLKKFTDAMTMGAKLMKDESYTDAIEIYEKAVAIAPDGNTKASQDLEKAKLALNKQQAGAREKRLHELMELGLKQRTDRQYEASLETFKKAKEEFPDNAEVGKQLASAEKWIKALQELTD